MTHPRSRLPLRRLALLATALLGFMGLTGLMAGAPVIAQRRPMQTSGPSIADVQRRAASLNPGLQTQVSTASAGVELVPMPAGALSTVPRSAATLPTVSEIATRLGTRQSFDWTATIGYRSGFVHDMSGGTRVWARSFGEHIVLERDNDLVVVLADGRQVGSTDFLRAGFAITIDRPQPNHGYVFTCTAYVAGEGREAGFWDGLVTQMTTGLREARALSYTWENRGSEQSHRIVFMVRGAQGQRTDETLGGLGALDACQVRSYPL